MMRRRRAQAARPQAGQLGRVLALAGMGTLGVGALSAGAALTAGLTALTRVRAPVQAPPATVLDVAPSHRHRTSVQVTLTGEGADLPGWGVLRGGGGALLASPPEACDGAWRREATALPGTAPGILEPGMPATVDHDPWRGVKDPFGLGAFEASYQSPVGPVAVTYAGPSARQAVVFVHGRGGTRTTGWWYAPTAAEEGWRTVMPAYRNDADGGPRTGRYLLGGEWVDLEVVLADLGRQGVRRVVLVGWSMGGNICASYLRERHRRPRRFRSHPRIVGLVLDAAALDWRAVLEHVARTRRLPHQIVPAVMSWARLTAGIEWHDLDHLTEPDHLALPVLAYHGTDDDVVPATTSRRLALALPHALLDEYVGAGHCRSVNHDPGRYLGTFRGFLRRVAADA